MTLLALDVTSRPGLAYQHAFDWLAVHLHASSPPVAALVGPIWQLLEIRRRLPDIALLNVRDMDAQAVANALGSPLSRSVELPGNMWAAVGWVEPAATDRPMFDKLYQCLLPYGRLSVVAHGWLGSHLAEQRRDGRSAILRAAEVETIAAEAGFHVVERFGLHPPRAIIHHYRGEIALVMGRRDWSDRRHFAMRRSMVTGGRAARLSALVCLAMERAQ